MERLGVMRTSRIFDDGQPAGILSALQDVNREAAPQTPAVIAKSPVMHEILAFVRRVAESEAGTILLDGETGSGKDLIANTLHYQSLRQAGPFVAVNCAAFPGALLESELFGYEQGAFTGALARKRGIFEAADGGTLFLDEIGEAPLLLQAKLLRVLEEQTFRRLGGLTDIRLDLRVVAATNRNLRDAVKQRAFRQDLYFRLNLIQITVAPLRERIDDILPLANFFIDLYNRKFNSSIEGLTDLAIQLLLSYSWPGNVRELRNAIERGMILEDSALIKSSSLPVAISRPGRCLPVKMPPRSELQDNQSQPARLMRVARDRLRRRRKKSHLP